MENPYEGQYYQPYTPEPEPQSPVYEGNPALATASLVMGILSLLSLCCFPLGTVLFAGLGILFSCLSKGEYTRLAPAKTGMVICTACLSFITILTITLSAMFLSSEEGRSFLKDYAGLITSGEVTEEELYDFLEKYLPEGSENYDPDSFPDSVFPFEDYEDGGDYEDDFPNYYEQPDSEDNGNFI